MCDTRVKERYMNAPILHSNESNSEDITRLLPCAYFFGCNLTRSESSIILLSTVELFSSISTSTTYV